MQTYTKIIFPYYAGNIRLTKVLGYVPYEYLVQAIREPKPPTYRLLNAIQGVSNCNKALKKELKKHLFSFTPSVIVGLGQKRNYDNIIEFTGLMQLDLDGIEDVEELQELKMELFSHEFVLTVFESPSKKGLKALVKINKAKNILQYKAIHKAFKQYVGINEYFDNATQNAVLPMYLSYDENILFRSFYDTTAFGGEDWSDDSAINLKTIAETVFVPDGTESIRAKNYREKTIRIFTTKMRGIGDNGHVQLRSACLILGSRVRAGYISMEQAESIAVSEVMNNEYLGKGISNYVKTARWSLSKGYENGGKYY